MAAAPTPDADVLILGGGCAGLSLACALAEAGFRGVVKIVEPRTHYERDRTWCFWDTEEHPFTDLISAAWRRWRVSVPGLPVLCVSERYRYCHIDSADFYRCAQSIIERTEGFSLLLGVQATAISPRSNGCVQVETTQGPLLARQVFDSRPRAQKSSSPLLVQRFCGWRVTTPEPRFDPATVELMRFLPAPDSDRIRFLYVLPFSPCEALVEWTQFDSPEQCAAEAPALLDRHLSDWLNQNVPNWSVIHRESGALPMGLGPLAVATEPGVHSIGIRGGCLKASSGYAFLRIQRHSRAIARALACGEPVRDWTEPALTSWMDAVFLSALRRTPAQAPLLFTRLFARTPVDSMVRFLSDSCSTRELLRAGWALPKWPMARAALHVAMGVN